MMPNVAKSPVSLEESLRFLTEVIDRQWSSYTWNDGKCQALITVNSILGAGVFVSAASLNYSTVVAVLLAVAICCVALSLIFCLRHAIPRLASGVSGPADNLRAHTGITAHTSFGAYEVAVRALHLEKHLELAARQAYGMAHNNIRSHRLVRGAARLTMAACICLAAAAIVTIFAYSGSGPASKPTPTTSEHKQVRTAVLTKPPEKVKINPMAKERRQSNEER